ncbi:hypothetical protein R4M03_00955 [Brachyspira pilosicoli]|uniref:DUF4468 domain-containing protein n=5 Tax=Brachyspira pilosicoli TaxID=52584 RepID=D8IE20_BRAP9|nr:hypothetical protein [Brachyspira pilosicoli]ADK31393.1 hypothetical protein BP951000_1409 [Brachyspira pilosicoli 95/1000]AFR71851.1 hypothetical protein B2904_orf2526 [Brachyspira pilosicoli B2904]AGA66809.1 hypothetical protein BPP43_08045 [Brachyspira pilosicoli P43/6/78]PLV64455.1 hypothetical protein BPSP16_00870 [Brachyspira pilosicoli SP16]CCG55691.1 hypothetical protein WESB_0219 [Brachyspira pilosicoli WesB]
MKNKLKYLFILLLLFVNNLFSEQKIFLSSNLIGDDLRKKIVNWVKESSINEENYKILDNGFIYFFYVSNIDDENKFLCFDITFNLQYDKFIVDFSNPKIFDKEKNEIKDLEFSTLSKLTKTGWFKSYNEEIDKIVEELENIIN